MGQKTSKKRKKKDAMMLVIQTKEYGSPKTERIRIPKDEHGLFCAEYDWAGGYGGWYRGHSSSPSEAKLRPKAHMTRQEDGEDHEKGIVCRVVGTDQKKIQAFAQAIETRQLKRSSELRIKDYDAIWIEVVGG